MNETGVCFSQKCSNAKIMKSFIITDIYCHCHTALLSEVVYMSDKILQVAIGSCDLSQDENRFTVVYKLSKFTK